MKKWEVEEEPIDAKEAAAADDEDGEEDDHDEATTTDPTTTTTTASTATTASTTTYSKMDVLSRKGGNMADDILKDHPGNIRYYKIIAHKKNSRTGVHRRRQRKPKLSRT